MTSDYFLICGLVPQPKQTVSASSASNCKLRVSQTNLPHFAQVVLRWLPSLGPLSIVEEIENFAKGISRALENALKAVGKRPNKKSERGAPWWTSECKSAHLDYRQVVEEPERSKQAWLFIKKGYEAIRCGERIA